MADASCARVDVRAGVRAGAALVVLVLSACAVGPDYRRPATVLPADYEASANPASSVASEGSVASDIPSDWWKLYADPLLEQLVTAATANNPNVRLAIARIDEARAVLRQTTAALFPEVDLSAAGARQRVGVAGGSSGASAAASTGVGATTGSTSTTTAGVGAVRYGNFFQLEAGVSYELDLWGRLRRLSESAQDQLLATTYARDVTILSLAGTTAQSYFALRSLDAQIAVTQGTLKAVGESLDLAKRRLDAGYSSGLDYAQAETLRAQIAVQLRDLRRQRTLQEHQLANLTSNPTLRIEAGNLDALPVPLTPPPGLPSTLLERRPDVRSAEAALAATNAQIGAAKAALFPRFGLTGAYGGQSFDLSDLLKAPFRFWSIGLGVSQPIFAAGKYLARVDQARAQTDEQVASYQSTVESAFQEVSNALTNVSESAATESEVQTQVDAARRSLRLSRSRYQQGYSGYLDVLDATRTANSAELLLVQNRQARLSYSVDLFRALGGGWGNADLATIGTPVQAPKPLDAVSNPPPINAGSPR